MTGVRASSRAAQILGVLTGLLGVALLAASSAAANYETVKTFAEPEGKDVRGRSGLAINVGGAGGVEPGSLYVVERLGVGAGGVNRYDARGNLQGRWGEFAATGVAVEQSSGYVYVLQPQIQSTGPIRVFSADGSEEITSFGELGAAGETIEAGPAKFHQAPFAGSMAVDATGKVYVADRTGFPPFESRIMTFEPETPGDLEHYVYAGREDDIAVGEQPLHPVLDGAGNLYVTSGEEGIEEFAPGETDTPSCEFSYPIGGIVGLTVNSLSGKVYFFTDKDKEKKVHVLAPCNPQGKFEELQAEAIKPAPKPAEGSFEAMAFNPSLTWEEGRPPGVLYAASSSPHEPELDYIFAGPVSHRPVIESESVAKVTATTANLRAQINPKGTTTDYVFQYLTEAAYEANEPGDRFAGASEAPPGGAELGAGQSPLAAAAAISGLAPDTEYRYRVIASSVEGVDGGDAESFRTYPLQAPGLPDSRAYELVSPAQKHGGEVFPANPTLYSCAAECKPGSLDKRFPLQSAPSGDAVAYQGSPFSPGEGAAKANEYVSKRTDSGWETANPTPALAAGLLAGYEAFDPSLSTAFFYQGKPPTLSPEAPLGYANLYRQSLADPTALAPLLPLAPPNRSTQTFQLKYASASADLSHALLAANDALTGATAVAPEAVDPSAPSKEDNLYEWVGGALRLVNVMPGNAETVPGAVFGSGSKLSKETAGGGLEFGVDFSHAISEDGSRIFWSSESGQLYVRIDGEETREVLDHEGQFLVASADGSRVLLGDGCLYDLETESCEDLTNGQGGFEGIAGAGEDLGSIYFVDSAALTPETEVNANGEHAQATEHNLYSWQEGGLAFIGTLDPEDLRSWATAPLVRTAEASPDGQWVAFLSRARLTGQDNTGPCVFESLSQKILPGPCPEAFLFDAASGKLVCASCDRSGELPLGPSSLPTVSASSSAPFPQPRYLTDAGRLLFDTRDSLSPFDTNGDVEDVYEYEPEGVGSCKREGGCTSLISAGRGAVDSNFLAIDPSAENVFFTSRDPLLLADQDELIDLYDAREGGGFPEEGTPGECGGEACQPSAPPQGERPPGSLGLQGPGNVHHKRSGKKHHRARHRKKRRRHHARGHHRRAAHAGRANESRGRARR